MNTQKFMGKTLLVLTVTSCTYSNNALEQALQSAGNNRGQNTGETWAISRHP